MSFQAYLDNIQAKTGKKPQEFRTYAAQQGWMTEGRLRSDIKAGTMVADLKKDFGLGHGHAMAIVALLQGRKLEDDA